MNQDDIIRMAREAVEDAKLPFSKPEHPISIAAFCESLAMQVAAAEREACAKVCHDKAWELKERSMKETVKTQRARLASEAAAWHDAFTAIRARGQQ